MADLPASYRLVRPDDHLQLGVLVERLRHVAGAASTPVRLTADVKDAAGQPLDGALGLSFEPQHTVEWANTGQPRPIFGNRSVLRFIVKHGTSVQLTVEGILQAVQTMSLVPAGPPLDDDDDLAADPLPPCQTADDLLA